MARLFCGCICLAFLFQLEYVLSVAEMFCPLPTSFQHGKLLRYLGGEYKLALKEYAKPKELLRVQCDDGYIYTNGRRPDWHVLLCRENGTWDRELGQCEEIFCPEPRPPKNGAIVGLQSNQTLFPYNSEVTCVCNEGYRLIGASVRKCSSCGWSPRPRCRVVRCPDPGHLDHGYRKGADLSVGARVVFRCFWGYELLGPVEIICLPNGQWNGQTARCNDKRNHCPDPGVPINGKRKNSDFNESSIVWFYCKRGYSLLGSSGRKCLSNGTWTGEEPRCIGPYDFDNVAKSDVFLEAIEKKSEQDEERKLLCKTEGRLFLYFVIDSSGSITQTFFNHSIQLAKAIIKRVKVTPEGARSGAVIFHKRAEVVYKPDDLTTTDEVIKALNQIKYTGGGSSPNAGLRMVITDLMSSGETLWRNSKSVVFVLTDGHVNTGGDPEMEANNLKELGVEIYCIGVTGNLNQVNLYKMASEPKDEHVFIWDSSVGMAHLVDKIINGTIDYSKCGIGIENVNVDTNDDSEFDGKAKKRWPWMIAVYNIDNQHICGGTIIDRRYILTASHCFFTTDKHGNKTQREKEEFFVKTGLFKEAEENTELQELEIDDIIIHPEYHPRLFDNDVALIRLQYPIAFKSTVRRICLPGLDDTLHEDLNKRPSVTLRWDDDRRRSLFPGTVSDNYLNKIHLEIKSKEECQKDNTNFNGNSMLCAGKFKENSEDMVCSGDSGGPLMVQELKEGEIVWKQVGVVTFGYRCQLGKFSIFQDVRKFISFIYSTISKG